MAKAKGKHIGRLDGLNAEKFAKIKKVLVRPGRRCGLVDGRNGKSNRHQYIECESVSKRDGSPLRLKKRLCKRECA